MFQPPVFFQDAVQAPCGMKEEREEVRLSDCGVSGVNGVKAEESEICIGAADGIEVHVKDEPEEQTLSEETPQYAEFGEEITNQSFQSIIFSPNFSTNQEKHADLKCYPCPHYLQWVVSGWGEWYAYHSHELKAGCL
ncbi:hypothetical protein SRHO_G00088630 [Serrasalmus rhombeus]